MSIYDKHPVSLGIGIGLGAALLFTGVVACSNDDEKSGEGTDVEDVQQRDMNKVEQYAQVEGYAHLVRACIDGVAFVFTGSEQQPVLRVPEFDVTYCSIPPSPTLNEPEPVPVPSGSIVE